jgi:hypothetical protein
MTRQFHAVAVAVAVLAMTVGVAAQGQGAGASTSRKVTIGENVLAAGMPLAPGTYEIRLMAASDGVAAQRDVEFVANGAVVARETAEIVPATGVVGTSGGDSRAKVEKLKGGEFVRVSFVEGGDRFLIHLPTTSR